MSFLKSSFKYGVPFLSFVVLGSFVLKEFTSIRYEIYGYKKRFGKTNIKSEYANQYNEHGGDLVDDKAEIENLMEMGAKNEWENIRGPRPWEDNRQFNELVEKIQNKTK